MARRRSIESIVKREQREDAKLRKAMTTKDASLTTDAQKALDSFVNFAQKMGLGADNALSTAGYGFNPLSRIRTTLEWIHRGSWIGGVAVDVVADDMTRAGVDILGELAPYQIGQIEECVTSLGVWSAINDTIKWARLYGGCIAVMMIDGQDMETPLNLDRIGKDQFKGLFVLDRWMIEPTLNDLVTTMGPELGLPKFYNITADAPALPRLKIHHSRCIRLEGVRLPYWQRLQENLWGISVLERLYDRMVAFDSATSGSAQLVYKAFIRTYKVDGLREVVAAGGDALAGLVKYVEMMRRFQGIEGITLLDGKDEFEAMSSTSFTGLADALTSFGEQLSGALQIPLVRLFGQSPRGFSTGDTDLRNYYDKINQEQMKDLHVPVTKVYRAVAASKGIKLPDGFKIKFRPLWQMSDTEKADVANKVTDAVTKAHDSGLISDKGAMQELRQSSYQTGVFTNITDDDINSASEDITPPMAEEAMGGASEGGQSEPGKPSDPEAAASAQKEAVPNVEGDKA